MTPNQKSKNVQSQHQIENSISQQQNFGFNYEDIFNENAMGFKSSGKKSKKMDIEK